VKIKTAKRKLKSKVWSNLRSSGASKSAKRKPLQASYSGNESDVKPKD